MSPRAIILGLILLTTMAACGGSSDNNSPPKANPAKTQHAPTSKFDKAVIAHIKALYGKGGSAECFVGLHTAPTTTWKMDDYYVYVPLTSPAGNNLHGPLSIHYEHDKAQTDGVNVNIQRPDGTPNPMTAAIFRTVNC